MIVCLWVALRHPEACASCRCVGRQRNYAPQMLARMVDNQAEKREELRAEMQGIRGKIDQRINEPATMQTSRPIGTKAV